MFQATLNIVTASLASTAFLTTAGRFIYCRFKQIVRYADYALEHWMQFFLHLQFAANFKNGASRPEKVKMQ